MITKKSWQEFRESGLLWWINMILHTFGWAIVVYVEEDGTISDAHPARVKYRGFAEEYNTEGYQKVSCHLKEIAEVLEQEAKE